MSGEVLFKVGDKVYTTQFGNGLCTVTSISKSGVEYPISVVNCLGIFSATFTTDGRYFSGDGFPSLFKANQQNRDCLSRLYGVEFEKE